MTVIAVIAAVVRIFSPRFGCCRLLRRCCRSGEDGMGIDRSVGGLLFRPPTWLLLLSSRIFLIPCDFEFINTPRFNPSPL
ncbi:uncharacterized protein P884DRAFT_262497 [Thermothelomyces heterothallicus CBS 202.75]|uniref:uncharacterized protein n=1 Tax=Thermothelomyces heterothallicus CBS 202.75 TaxID=1149848 RepID=UPI0037439ED4